MEYKIVQLNARDDDQTLNDYANQGYSFISLCQDAADYTWWATLMRPR
jgi:hypothetical protein